MGRGGAFLKIFGAGAPRGSQFPRGRGGAGRASLDPREELFQFVASLDNRVRPMDITYHLPLRGFSNQESGLGLLTDSSGLSLSRASPNISLAGRQVASRSLFSCIEPGFCQGVNEVERLAANLMAANIVVAANIASNAAGAKVDHLLSAQI